MQELISKPKQLLTLSYEQLDTPEFLEDTDSTSNTHSNFSRRVFDNRGIERTPLTKLKEFGKYFQVSSVAHKLKVNSRITDIPQTTLATLGTSNFESKGITRKGFSVGHGSGVGGTIELKGKTEASFDHTFKTSGVKITKAEGCDCSDDECVRARGKINTSYTVGTTVTLPNASEYPDLTNEQKRRFNRAVREKLAPHEHEHVVVFNKYRGNTTKPFDITTCKGDLSDSIESMVDEEESVRRQAVQDESDDLDPFSFTFKL